jgi:GTP-binding protein
MTKQGTEKLARALMDWLEERNQNLAENPELAEEDEELRAIVEEEARERIETLSARRKATRASEKLANEDEDDDDDHDVEVIYEL